MQGASLEEQRNRLAVFRRSLFSIFYIHILCMAQTKQFRSEADAAAAAAIFAPEHSELDLQGI